MVSFKIPFFCCALPETTYHGTYLHLTKEVPLLWRISHQKAKQVSLILANWNSGKQSLGILCVVFRKGAKQIYLTKFNVYFNQREPLLVYRFVCNLIFIFAFYISLISVINLDFYFYSRKKLRTWWKEIEVAALPCWQIEGKVQNYKIIFKVVHFSYFQVSLNLN